MSVAPMPQSPLTAAQRSLVESALPSVKRYVRWLTPRFYPHPFEELFQIASEAASRTARRHDPARGPFVTYCLGRVLGEIIDYAEADRRRRASLRALRRTLSEVSEVFSDPGDPFTEPAEARLERFQELRDAMGAALALGLLSPTTPEDAYLAEEERRHADTLAQAALEVLGPEHRSTAVAYFFQGRSLDAIFAERGESYFPARQRFIRALARVGRAFRARAANGYSAEEK